MLFYILSLLGLLSIASAVSTGGGRLLIVLEELAEKNKYSQYFADLEERQFKLSFESPKSENVALFSLGERAYDHVLVLPTKAKGLGPNLTPKIFLDFVNAGGNILLALSGKSSIPSGIVSLLLELDIQLPSERGSYVVDHFNYESKSAPEHHDVLLLPRPAALRPDVHNFFAGGPDIGDKTEIIALPHAVGQTLGNDSPLLTPILRAARTAYMYSPKEDSDDEEAKPVEAGQQISLITAMQARNSARITVLGSAEMLQNDWFDRKVQGGVAAKDVKTVNRAFAKELSGWTFQEIGMLKVNTVTHYLDENKEKPNPSIYRVKQDVTYEISISEHLWDTWVPFVPSTGDDIQLEFSMLSPFHRLALRPITTTANATVFRASLRTPDQHGIFNFKVNHKRPFYSNLEEKKQVTVRHFAHDEYPRSWSISGAWPWMTGIGVTIIGWLAFVAVWLWSRPVKGAATSAKKSQ